MGPDRASRRKSNHNNKGPGLVAFALAGLKDTLAVGMQSGQQGAEGPGRDRVTSDLKAGSTIRVQYCKRKGDKRRSGDQRNRQRGACGCPV